MLDLLGQRGGLTYYESAALAGAPAYRGEPDIYLYDEWLQSAAAGRPVALPRRARIRLALLQAIYVALARDHGLTGAAAHRWMGRRNDARPFGGQSPLAYISDRNTVRAFRATLNSVTSRARTPPAAAGTE